MKKELLKYYKIVQNHLIRYYRFIREWIEDIYSESRSKNGEERNGENAPNTGTEIRVTKIVLAVFIAIFALWSIFARIESAAVAPGIIEAAANDKRIKHIQGGVIEEVHVRNNQRVNKGDVLMELDNTNAKSNYEILQTKLDTYRVVKARLNAAINDEVELDFSDQDFTKTDNPDIKALIERQTRLFRASLYRYVSEKRVIQKQLNQMEERLDSLTREIATSDELLSLVQEELDMVLILEERKLVRKPRILALKREKARLVASKEQLNGQIRELEKRREEYESRLVVATNQWYENLLSQLQEVQSEIDETRLRLIAANDAYKRTRIIAPENGIVTELKFRNKGEVIQPYESIMNIVPTEGEYAIDARISPTDRDVVHPGMEAEVRITAFNMREVPAVRGVVESVSADATVDNSTLSSYYTVRIQLKDKLLENPNIRLVSGMPVEVMIINDRRSPLGYIFGPFLESFNRAFREQ